jgi:hypothetical protein
MTEFASPAVDDVWAWDAQARQAWLAGDFALARRLFEQVLAAQRLRGEPADTLYALLHVTQAMRFEPGYDPTAARPLLEEALSLAQQIGSSRYLTPVQCDLLVLELEAGHYAVALAGLQRLLPTFVQFPDPDGTCYVLENITKALIGLGQAEPALRLYAAATATRARRGTSHTTQAYLAREARALAPAHEQLGAERSAAAETEGQAMSLEEAVAYALSLPVSE